MSFYVNESVKPNKRAESNLKTTFEPCDDNSINNVLSTSLNNRKLRHSLTHFVSKFGLTSQRKGFQLGS
uniref:Uncharacterized protein n=1 Tax=Tetranychus urticae TaxID=32264 RepID=T1L0L8_TETUR